MRGVTAHPITIEEFDKLDLPQDRQWELRNGEVVELTFPVIVHRNLQVRILHLLEGAFPKAHILMEYPFQIVETTDKRSADVGVTSKERGDLAQEKGILEGPPELIVEVLSPSNSLLQLKRDRRVYFEHGTLIFITVDPEDNTIEVQIKGEPFPRHLTLADILHLSLFGEDKSIAVAAIFDGITTNLTR